MESYMKYNIISKHKKDIPKTGESENENEMYFTKLLAK